MYVGMHVCACLCMSKVQHITYFVKLLLLLLLLHLNAWTMPDASFLKRRYIFDMRQIIINVLLVLFISLATVHVKVETFFCGIFAFRKTTQYQTLSNPLPATKNKRKSKQDHQRLFATKNAKQTLH